MKKLIRNMDIPLLIVTFVFIVFGLIMIYSSSSISAVLRYNKSSYYFFIKQLIAILLGLIGSIVLIFFPTKIYQKLTPLLIIGMFGSLIYVLCYGIIINNSQSWIKVFGFSIQPAEFAKSIMIIYIAAFFGRIKNDNNKLPFYYLTPLIFGGAACLLILAQPDFGGAVIFCTIIFFLFMSVPYIQTHKKNIYKIIFGLLIIIGTIVLLFGSSLINNERFKRFNYFNPCSRYTEETGYQLCNGFIAINEGGFFGKGLGNSTQKYLYLPESHTDFIFPVICEELGAICGVLVLIGYSVMLYRIYKISKESVTLRGSLLAYGTFLFLLCHILVNILGVFGLIPLTGVPLPLLSYGGSFAINIVIMLFITQKVAIETNINKKRLEIKKI